MVATGAGGLTGAPSAERSGICRIGPIECRAS